MTKRNNKSLSTNTIIVSLLLGLSSVLGLLRESVIANKFGASILTDMYLVALIIPTIVATTFNTAITNVFTTIYSNFLEKKQDIEAINFRKTITLLLFLLILIISILIWFFSPRLISIIASSYTQEQLIETIKLTRLLIPFMILNSMLCIYVGINNSHRQFHLPAINNLIMNLIVIVLILFFSDYIGIYALPMGLTCSVLFQFIIQYFNANKISDFKDYSHYKISVKNPGVNEMFILTFPFLLSTIASQINAIVDRSLSTGLDPGRLSSLYFAHKLISLPQGIFSAALGVVLLPFLIKAIVNNDYQSLSNNIINATRLIVLFILPCLTGLYLLRKPIVDLLFLHGNFLENNARITADIIPYFFSVLIFGSIITVLISLYMALKKVWIVIFSSVVTAGLNILFSIQLVKIMDEKGLALATSLATFVNFLILFVGLFLKIKLHKKISLSYSKFGKFLLICVTANILMAISILILLNTLENTILTIVGAIIIYFIILILFRIEEVTSILVKGRSIVRRRT